MKNNQEHTHTSKSCEVICAFKFAWAKQMDIIKLVACPLALMILYYLFNYMVQHMMMSAATITNPQDVSTAMAGVGLSGTQIALNLLATILAFVASMMMAVRLLRFNLLGEDATKVPFFSFGTREWRYLGNSFLIGLVSVLPLIILGFIPLFMGMKAIGIIGIVIGIMAMLFIFTRLVFIFPALALDKPTSFKEAWSQMDGVFGGFIITMLLLALCNIGFVIVCIMIPSMIVGFIFGLIGLVSIVPIILIPLQMWGTLMMNTVFYHIVSERYKAEVLPKETSK